MFRILKQFANGHLDSFNNLPGGFSGKKLSAFYIILLTIILEGLYSRWSFDHPSDIKAWVYLPELTAINLAFGAAALSINGWEKIKLNKKKDEKTSGDIDPTDNNQLQ